MVRYFEAQHAGDRLHNEKNREESKKFRTWVAGCPTAYAMSHYKYLFVLRLNPVGPPVFPETRRLRQ